MAFTLFNIRFRIEFSFLLIIFLSLLVGNNSLLWLVVFSSLHEIGHILAIMIFGGKIELITVSYYGIGMKQSAQLCPLQELIFLLCGVAVNLLFVLFNVQREINFALALVNVLPVYPLDGGRSLNVLACLVFNCDVAYKITVAVSAITTAVLLAAALILRNISLIMIVIYIVFYFINFRGLYDKKRS